MSMWTSLEPAAITVDPGSVASVRLRVRNTGDTVEEYRLRPAGAAAGWTRVEPDVLRLYPGAEGTAQVEFSPPRTSDSAAGPTPFGIRVEPAEHPEIRDVVEGQITVGPFAELRCELVPLAVRGRWRAKAAVAVDNLGNQPLTVSLSGRENGDALTVEPEPTSVQAAPGRAAFANLSIRPGTVSWVGGTSKHPFTLSVQRAGAPEPTELRGTYIQPSVLPRWVMAVCSLLLVAALAFVALWFKAAPTVLTSAKEKPAPAGSKLPQEGKKPDPAASPSDKPSEKPPPAPPPPPPPEEKKPEEEGPKAQTIRSNINGGWYLQANGGSQVDGTQIGQNPEWTGDQFGRNQWWIIHHYAEDNTVALESASAPGSVAQLKPDTNEVELWAADPEQLKTGRLPPHQKWRLADAADGRTRIINLRNQECLTDVQNDKGALSTGCADGPWDRQDWKIAEGP
ncbi:MULTISPECIES: hydrogenase expression protein [unclassified Streptomyces]|uniref:hydrogenase expression protein n=1 Tax=unclassified Streptomyces TaxID=2593676 RepID=UPI000E5B14A0|nr:MULTISPECIES: hydrogenase expression protein [unclassified Streptomyces]